MDENVDDGTPKSLLIAGRGISTSRDFATLMSALMCDLIAGRITPSVGNATCNAGGKLLKVVEMQIRHGKGTGDKTLHLTGNTETAPAS
jgi:hypothetical protein